MNAWLLSGNSSWHNEWVEDLKIALITHFEHIETQHYLHWQRSGHEADIEYEIGIAQIKLEKLKPYIVITKSIDTVISVKRVVDKRLKPEKIILIGVPINSDLDVDSFSKGTYIFDKII